MSDGGAFLIFMTVGLGSYLGLGYGYNHKYNELSGTDALPQIECGGGHFARWGRRARRRRGLAGRTHPPTSRGTPQTAGTCRARYWREVPGLVRDGCAFSYAMGSAYVKHLRSGDSGEPALTEALAQSEDGGPATEYKEGL
jgi:hypothetical protein